MALLQDLRGRGRSGAEVLRRRLAPARPAVDRVRPVVAAVSPLGWVVLLAAVGCWIVGWQLGWVEFMLMAAAAVLLFLLCALMTIGRTQLQVRIDVNPLRATVGTASTGRVHITNKARGVLLPIALEVPIGRSAARFDLPVLRSGAEHEELFVVPTQRRGVVPIGPAVTVRGDPLGLLARTVTWTDRLELFVHPRTVPIEPLGAGLLRDLEGRTTSDVSMSDLAFHALRDYVPGDDRRYIHWRSSAKAGRFMVRQFLDTRRTHITTVVDSASGSYDDPEDYETAISAAASIAVRTVLDDQEVSVVAADHAVRGASGPGALDTFARAELGGHGIGDLAARAARIAPETSIALLITGRAVPYATLQAASLHFPPETRVVALRVDPFSPTGLSGNRSLLVLTLRNLADLPALLAGTPS